MLSVQLRSFHAVATTGSFTSAARKLRVSQPTVTAQVKALEEHYGVELFYRHSRGAMLTEDGGRLLAIVQRIVANQEDAIDFLKEIAGGRKGHLRIGAVGPFQVTEILARFGERFPGIGVSVTPGNSRTLLDKLYDYEADVAIVGRLVDFERLHALHYSRPEIVIIVNRNHPWNGRSSIRIEELQGQRMIFREKGSETRRILEEAVRRAGIEPTQAIEYGDHAGLVAAVARDIGIGAISEEEYVDLPDLRKLEVADAQMHTDVYVACLKERRDSRIISAFMDVAAGMVRTGS